jgi:hypothetical protein
MAASFATLQLSSIDYNVSYSTTNQTRATIAVIRTGDMTQAVSVDYTTSDLTAVAGTDYTQASGALSFGPGEAEKTFDISILRKDHNPSAAKKVAILELKNPDPPDKARLGSPQKATLSITPPGIADIPAGGAKRAELVLQYLIFGLLGGIFVYFLMNGVLGDKSILGDLADIETARGLITFLIAVCTVAIALILSISSIISRGTKAGQRFTQGKEVLTLLIGVLGTIVGFYFGTSAKGTPQPLQISAIQFSPDAPKLGEKLKITATVVGGKPLYAYSIKFSPPLIEEATGSSKDGKIEHEVTIPSSITNPQEEVGFQITVTDGEGKTVTKAAEKKFTIKKAATVP